MRAEPGPGGRGGSERGAALLTVLMLVAVIAVMAGTALERLRLSTRLAGNAIAVEQARGYARAAEVMATTRIDGLLGRDASRVTLQGGWSGRPYALPLPGGAIATARVTDGGNCFNLNSLVKQAGDVPGIYEANQTTRAQFARLMRLVGAPAQASELVSAAAADWMDTDQDQQPNGAEDAVYLAKVQPYRTAGTLMADPSELRVVEGVTPAIYAKIRPWVCTLPVAETVKLNVNTLLPEQAPLVAALSPDTVSVEMARRMILARPPAGFASVDNFWKTASLDGQVAGQAQGYTAITTTWFNLAIEVNGPGNAGGVLEQHGVIDARKLPSRIVSRQWGEAS